MGAVRIAAGAMVDAIRVTTPTLGRPTVPVGASTPARPLYLEQGEVDVPRILRFLLSAAGSGNLTATVHGSLR
jgi:hypothetical protein